jgi:hypothetical protein
MAVTSLPLMMIWPESMRIAPEMALSSVAADDDSEIARSQRKAQAIECNLFVGQAAIEQVSGILDLQHLSLLIVGGRPSSNLPP